MVIVNKIVMTIVKIPKFEYLTYLFMQDLQDEFPAIQNQTYLNTASSGLIPRSVFDWRKQHEIDLFHMIDSFSIKVSTRVATHSILCHFPDQGNLVSSSI